MADGEVAKSGDVALSLGKFQHPDFTAAGAARAHVALNRLETLWINTGTLCNIECAHCYIESSPKNDRLAYLTLSEITPFLDEAAQSGACEIGFTGGEPFLNPEMIAMADAALRRGFEALILTNAMRPMMRPRVTDGLLDLHRHFERRINLRVSLDHFDPARHDHERIAGSFASAMNGMRWLVDHGFQFSVATRDLWGEGETAMRDGFAALFLAAAIPLDARNPMHLILFPELDEAADVPEISTDCWAVLGKDPGAVMCASSRMVVKRKGAAAPVVLSCTLLPYDSRFEMGETIADASGPVKLNHPHCAKFCVLGGASCSR